MMIVTTTISIPIVTTIVHPSVHSPRDLGDHLARDDTLLAEPRGGDQKCSTVVFSKGLEV